jgi:ATP-dependent DNA helicase DinG
MLAAVERAFVRERPTLIEAGTGTGKTLAYLIPAVLSQRTVVISTATHALQEQMVHKDIPLVRTLLAEHPFEVRVMKGISNYVCRRRYQEAFGANPKALASVSEWLAQTQTGDRAEYSGRSKALPTVLSSAETRVGSSCAHYEQCFVTRMRKEAESAQILIVNHHLFFADLALRTSARGEYASVIPPYDAVIFDEAHHVEDAATDFFGERLSLANLLSLASDMIRLLPALTGMATQLEQRARNFFRAFPHGERRGLEAADYTSHVTECETLVRAALEACELACASVELGQSLARRLQAASRVLQEVRDTVASQGRGAWLEPQSADETAASLGVSPISIAPIFERVLWGRAGTVVLTSATLTTALSSSEPGSFHYVRSRLGVPPDADELVVASPFDGAKKCMLYTPKDLPEPASEEHEAAACARAADLIELTGGGAFVLTTSNRALQSYSDYLRRLDLRVLVQNEAPKGELLDAFRSDGNAVLVATMSFWEGVDVPGQALRLVILDKIPFPVPTDPTLVARSKSIEEAGGNPFMELHVPMAATALKQGFGRLLRSETDAGLICILDRRIMTKGYGRRLLAGLPPSQRATQMHEVRSFWQREMGMSEPPQGVLETGV